MSDIKENIPKQTNEQKPNIVKDNFMVFSPITSWQIEGEKVEAVTDFGFMGSKITADGDCNHEIKGF